MIQGNNVLMLNADSASNVAKKIYVRMFSNGGHTLENIFNYVL